MGTAWFYRITVKGQLRAEWADWFDGMTLSLHMADDGTPVTTLTGPVADQAALRGILTRLWDFNLCVMSVTRIGSEEGELGT